MACSKPAEEQQARKVLVLISQHSQAADSPCGLAYCPCWSLGPTSMTTPHLLKRHPLPQLRQCCLIAGRLLSLQNLQHEGPSEGQAA